MGMWEGITVGSGVCGGGGGRGGRGGHAGGVASAGGARPRDPDMARVGKRGGRRWW